MGAAMTEVVTSYTELIAGIQAQVAALGVRLVDFDDLAGFPAGLSGKIFGPSQVKRLGPEKLFDALRAAGLRIRLEADEEQLEKMRSRIAEKYNPRQANQARPNNHSSPVGMQLTSRVFKHYAKIGGRNSWAKKSKKERFNHQRDASNARWRKYRKRVKAAMKGARTRKERLALIAEVQP
jgi:hypothetical protein